MLTFRLHQEGTGHAAKVTKWDERGAAMGDPNWNYLAAEAKAGWLLIVDPSVAKDCADACDELSKVLHAARVQLMQGNLQFMLGDFDCGNDLAKALFDQIRGDQGFRGRIEEHIEVVGQIRDVVGANVAKIVSQD